MTTSGWISSEDLGVHRAPTPDTQADAEKRVALALGRTPDRCDTRIARACETNIFVVREVRERLGAYPTRPA
jgi:hypothetical protein